MTPDSPNYHFPSGTAVTLPMGEMSIRDRTDHGYELVDLSSGEVRGISMQSLIDQLKLPGMAADTTEALTGNRLKQRLGGIAGVEGLTTEAQEESAFRVAICMGMQMVQERLRLETGKPRLRLNWRSIDRLRPEICDIAKTLFGKQIYLNGPRGGRKGDRWTLHKGRRLIDIFQDYEALQEGERPKDALAPLYHLQGNRDPRIPHRARELMTAAWEQAGLDLKSPSLANVHDRLELLIHEENVRRARNDLPVLIVPSVSTLRAHREQHLSDTAYLNATKGSTVARNRRGRGSTDIRALLVGEYVEIDECKASLVLSSKVAGIWERLSKSQREALREIDEIIRKRLYILVMIDVATRMPLAWVISDQPRAEATLQLFRMATRSKEREARKYGCEGQAINGVGVGYVKNDNGPGLRNATTIGTLVGLGIINIVSRAYAATDKPYIERLFGTVESVLLKLIHGYTGRKAGELPGYDAIANGVLDIEELNEILSRFFIDEYPAMRHTGVGMWSRRPIEVYNDINRTRGCIPPVDPDTRRIHLGWDVKATPTDEGVRVFGGIWFNSDKLQEMRESPKVKARKVSVFVDPDDINAATVVIRGIYEPITVHLQITAFADMTVPEVLELMAACRKEDHQKRVFYEDQIARTRRHRADRLDAIGVEHKLRRSYATFEECQRKAAAVFAGARITRTRVTGTVDPSEILNLTGTKDVYQIGAGPMLIEGLGEEIDPATESRPEDLDRHSENLPSPRKASKPSTARSPKSATKSTRAQFGRPQNTKDLLE